MTCTACGRRRLKSASNPPGQSNPMSDMISSTVRFSSSSEMQGWLMNPNRWLDLSSHLAARSASRVTTGGRAMDFPILDLMDEATCYQELLDLLHPDGLSCPRCRGGPERYTIHRYRDGSPVVDYRCRDCRRVFNLFTGTPWQGTHHSPARILLILRGFAQGTPTAELARELRASRPHLLARRHALQARAAAAARRAPPRGAAREV